MQLFYKGVHYCSVDTIWVHFLLFVFLSDPVRDLYPDICFSQWSGICPPASVQTFMQELHTAMYYGENKVLPQHRETFLSHSYQNSCYMAERRQQVFLGKRLQPSTMCDSASKDTAHKATNKYNEFSFDWKDHLLDHCTLPLTPPTQAHHSSSKLPTAIRCRRARQRLVSHTFPVTMNFVMLRPVQIWPWQFPESI